MSWVWNRLQGRLHNKASPVENRILYYFALHHETSKWLRNLQLSRCFVTQTDRWHRKMAQYHCINVTGFVDSLQPSAVSLAFARANKKWWISYAYKGFLGNDNCSCDAYIWRHKPISRKICELKITILWNCLAKIFVPMIPTGHNFPYSTPAHLKKWNPRSFANELLNLIPLTFWILHTNRIFQCVGKIFCV